jgi:DNA-binding HxlR family transcriptional regulator
MWYTAHMISVSTCPLQKTAELLCDTWTILVLRDLLAGPKRFCELERSLEGISTRTLTLKLKKLADDELIEKGEDSYYRVTQKGKALKPVERAMRRYGQQYLS